MHAGILFTLPHLTLSMSDPTPTDHPEEKFSPALFIVTILITLAGLFGALALLAPGLWKSQLAGSGGA